MSFVNFCPTCSANPHDCDCTNPAAQPLNCPTGKYVELSEIVMIIVDCNDPLDPSKPKTPIAGYSNTKPDDEIANETAITTWYNGINNATVGGIKALTVIGSKAAGEATTVQLPLGVEYDVSKRHSLAWRKPDTAQLTREWLNWAIGCLSNGKFWYVTKGCYIYGGENGIDIKKFTVDEVFAEGAEGIKNAEGTVIYESLCLPPRDRFPIAL